MKTRTALKLTTMVVTMIALLASLAAPASAVKHPDHGQKNRGNGPSSYDAGAGRKSPNGSNGTIKLDGISLDGTYDGHPNNEPHIRCVFEVDLYGFDSDGNGDIAQLMFRHWNPSGGKDEIVALGVAADDEGSGDFAPISYQGNRVFVPLNSDGAGGGVDLDRQVRIKLDIPEIDPGASGNHGHHVRLDALVVSAGRSYKKSKVFWVSGCDATPKFDCAVNGSIISWNSQGPFIDRYNVVQNGKVVATLGSDVTAWDAGGLYGAFTIEAVDVAGKVTMTEKACFIDAPPAPDFNCTAHPQSSTVSWTPVVLDAYESDYVVTATNRATGVVTVANVPAGTHTWGNGQQGLDVIIEATWVDGSSLVTASCYIPSAD